MRDDLEVGVSTFLSDEAEDLEGQVETRRFKIEANEHGLRIDKCLAERCPEFSRAYFQSLLQAETVLLNGKTVLKPAQKLKVGDAVSVELRPTAQAQAFLPEPIALSVVYEDAHLIVVNKPAGMVVHPAAGNWTGTLLNALLAYHEGASRLPRAGIVHRLDKDTSGLMLVGKTLVAVEALVRLIAQRRVHRIYLALAQGAWKGGADVLVDQALGRDPRNRLRMAVLPAQSTGAKSAQTEVRLLDASPLHVLVGCKLHTGRTHQIRVHMAWLGHPLVSDTVYSGRMALGMTRQALHATQLVLSHPITGQELRLDCPLPDDMACAVKTAGLHYNAGQLWQVTAT